MKRGGGRLITAVLVLGFGATVLGCGARHPVAADGGERHAGDKPAYTRVADVPEQVEPDGATVVVGDPDARVTVHLFEDPRCPYCRQFETTGGGPVLTKWVLTHKVKVEYTMASFLDGRLGGSGSKKAVNALRAALKEGKFAEYHTVLYLNQPPEEEDGYTDARLLQLAGKVEGLRTPSFESAVRSVKYQAFVDASEKSFAAAGHYNGHEGPGTPTAEVNGYRIPVEQGAILYQADLFDQFLAKVVDESA
ncbi:DsbA family protein [Streptomyces sp. IBSBF 3136]|uniref:DsbA family protein n=1 Tax=Streptomyces sp. IBSBF 3136 TaxID=2903524 RepID=UPI002FDBDD92